MFGALHILVNSTATCVFNALVYGGRALLLGGMMPSAAVEEL